MSFRAPPPAKLPLPARDAQTAAWHVEVSTRQGLGALDQAGSGQMEEHLGRRLAHPSGAVRDRHLQQRQVRLPQAGGQRLAGLGGPRGTDVATLAAHAREAGIAAEKLLSCDDIPAAYHHARTLARPEDTVVVFGSFVTVAAVLEKHI